MAGTQQDVRSERSRLCEETQYARMPHALWSSSSGLHGMYVKVPWGIVSPTLILISDMSALFVA